MSFKEEIFENFLGIVALKFSEETSEKNFRGVPGIDSGKYLKVLLKMTLNQFLNKFYEKFLNSVSDN